MTTASEPGPEVQHPTVTAILTDLDQGGYQMMSSDRIRRRIDPNLTDEALDSILRENPRVLRGAVLKGGKRALAKRIR